MRRNSFGKSRKRNAASELAAWSLRVENDMVMTRLGFVAALERMYLGIPKRMAEMVNCCWNAV